MHTEERQGEEAETLWEASVSRSLAKNGEMEGDAGVRGTLFKTIYLDRNDIVVREKKTKQEKEGREKG